VAKHISRDAELPKALDLAGLLGQAHTPLRAAGHWPAGLQLIPSMVALANLMVAYAVLSWLRRPLPLASTAQLTPASGCEAPSIRDEGTLALHGQGSPVDSVGSDNV
jgi:hypothetical protein